MGLNWGLLGGALAALGAAKLYKSHQDLAQENQLIDMQNNEMARQGIPQQYYLAHLPGMFNFGDPSAQTKLINDASQKQHDLYYTDQANDNRPTGVPKFLNAKDAADYRSKLLEGLGTTQAGYEHGKNRLIWDPIVRQQLLQTGQVGPIMPGQGQGQQGQQQNQQQGQPAQQDMLAPLENHVLGQTYTGDTPQARLERVETKLYGGPQGGDPVARIQAIYQDQKIPMNNTLQGNAQAGPSPELPPNLQGVQVTPEDLKEIEDNYKGQYQQGIETQNANTNLGRFNLENKKYNTIELPQEQRNEKLFPYSLTEKKNQAIHSGLENQYTDQQIKDMRQKFVEAQKLGPLKYREQVAKTAQEEAKANGTTYIQELNAMVKAKLIDQNTAMLAAKHKVLGDLAKPQPQKTLPQAKAQDIQKWYQRREQLENVIKNDSNPDVRASAQDELKTINAQIDAHTNVPITNQYQYGGAQSIAPIQIPNFIQQGVNAAGNMLNTPVPGFSSQPTQTQGLPSFKAWKQSKAGKK